MAWASPFFQKFDLRARGVELLVPEVSYAQPLPDGRAGVAYRDLERTVEELGVDGAVWRSLVGGDPAAAVRVALFDKRSVPLVDPRAALRFGLGILEQGTRAWDRRFVGDVAPALLTGVAAHAISPLPSIAAAGTALLLGTLAHAEGGWPIPRGGSGAITAALVRGPRGARRHHPHRPPGAQRGRPADRALLRVRHHPPHPGRRARPPHPPASAGRAGRVRVRRRGGQGRLRARRSGAVDRARRRAGRHRARRRHARRDGPRGERGRARRARGPADDAGQRPDRRRRHARGARPATPVDLRARAGRVRPGRDRGRHPAHRAVRARVPGRRRHVPVHARRPA